MKNHRNYILVGLLISLFNFQPIFGQESDLEKSDIVLINEVFYMQKVLGHEVWEEWLEQKTPFLYKKKNYEYLMFHNNPPIEYQQLTIENIEYPVYWKKNHDTLKYNATYSINKIPTVVMSAPDSSESKCEWVLLSIHEMFHVFQQQQISVELRSEFDFKAEEYQNYNEIDFPYNYYDEKTLAVQKIEADKIYYAIIQDSLSKSNANILMRRFADIYLIQQTILQDSIHIKYKSYMEWSEGVARYVEQQMAMLASNDKIYEPSLDFSLLYPEEDYSKISERYQTQSALSPIRFIGEGVLGRIMFYYMGMGKAYLLDKLRPGWKKLYFTATLDEQIIGEKQFLSCKLRY